MIEPAGGAIGHHGVADGENLDVGLAIETELLLSGKLGRYAVAVPTKAAFYPAPAHGKEAWYDILDYAGEDVTIVRQAGRKG